MFTKQKWKTLISLKTKGFRKATYSHLKVKQESFSSCSYSCKKCTENFCSQKCASSQYYFIVFPADIISRMILKSQLFFFFLRDWIHISHCLCGLNISPHQQLVPEKGRKRLWVYGLAPSEDNRRKHNRTGLWILTCSQNAYLRKGNFSWLVEVCVNTIDCAKVSRGAYLKEAVESH